jgi:CRP/FNR family transcriptional regulator, cyclic AMP receptor protein
MLEERRLTPARGVAPAASRLTSLLDLDVELASVLDPGRAALARPQLGVQHARFSPGPWAAARFGRAELFGLLVYRGVVAREVTLEGVDSLELTGPGDLLRPWEVPPGAGVLGHSIRWSVLTEARMAVLDRRVVSRLAAYPELMEALALRLAERTQRLAVTQAISQLTRVDDRLRMMLWHLVERWGRMTPEGAVLPLTLSHRQLAQLVGARRPSASSALSALAREGLVLRRGDGSWLLVGDPPALRG